MNPKDLKEKTTLQRQLAAVRTALAKATDTLNALKVEEDGIVATLRKRGWEEIEVEAGGAVAGAVIGLGLEVL